MLIQIQVAPGLNTQALAPIIFKAAIIKNAI